MKMTKNISKKDIIESCINDITSTNMWDPATWIPNFRSIKRYYVNKGVDYITWEDLLKTPEVRQDVFDKNNWKKYGYDLFSSPLYEAWLRAGQRFGVDRRDISKARYYFGCGWDDDPHLSETQRSYIENAKWEEGAAKRAAEAQRRKEAERQAELRRQEAERVERKRQEELCDEFESAISKLKENNAYDKYLALVNEYKPDDCNEITSTNYQDFINGERYVWLAGETDFYFSPFDAIGRLTWNNGESIVDILIRDSKEDIIALLEKNIADGLERKQLYEIRLAKAEKERKLIAEKKRKEAERLEQEENLRIAEHLRLYQLKYPFGGFQFWVSDPLVIAALVTAILYMFEPTAWEGFGGIFVISFICIWKLEKFYKKRNPDIVVRKKGIPAVTIHHWKAFQFFRTIFLIKFTSSLIAIGLRIPIIVAKWNIRLIIPGYGNKKQKEENLH